MTDQRIGATVRFLRIRLRWRQVDVAQRAGVSQSVVSRIERGHLDDVLVRSLRAVAAAVDLRLDVVGRWRGGDLDRLLGAGHSALHEAVAQRLGQMAGWKFAPEVSFSIYGERGVIDILAWHEPTGSLLVIELKTEFVDLNELLGTFDRKRRLAAAIAVERGWLRRVTSVSSWVVVVDDSTNRRRAREHGSMLRAALPADGRAMRRWLSDPRGSINALSFWPNSRPGTGKSGSRPIRTAKGRVRVAATHGSSVAAGRESARRPGKTL